MPNTLLFATGYLSNHADVEKYIRYYQYYQSKKLELGYDKLCVIDDGSLSYWIDDLAQELKGNFNIFKHTHLPKELPDGLNWITFNSHLGRPEWMVTAGWFRSFTFSSVLSKKYKFDKLIHIESDAFILSEKLFEKLRKTNTGWLTFWCQRHKFPETAIQVIAQDNLNNLKIFWDRQELTWYGARESDRNIAEFVFPFTEICKEYTGDRYGEDPINDIPINADYACQIAENHFKKIPGMIVRNKITDIEKRLCING